ncbi:MAG: cell envelope integrity protein TolA [Candidatus Lernaella stagnicola]|nr:cell envelope integrity protein TolA [Candidatus Lernaella stagnicola]
MIAISLAFHIAAFLIFAFAPDVLGSQHKALPEAIEVDLSYNLPKGPGLGPKAPDRNQEAVRRSDPRKAKDIMEERRQKASADAVKITKKRDVTSNRLGWKDRARMRAIERVREKQALVDSTGGGGTGTTNTKGVLGIYISNVQSRILSVWSFPGGLPDQYLRTTVKVRIYVSSSGSITNKIITKGSGFEPLDRSCLSAITKASPLPPPPQLLEKDMREKGITVRFHPKSKKP